MIKVLNCKKKNYVSQLNLLLEKRRSSARISTNIVTKIVSDVKKYKVKALLKYERRFSNNRQIKPSKEKIRKAIRSLDPKIKKAIDFAYKRILKFHSKQKTKNIKYIDNLNNKLKDDFVAQIQRFADLGNEISKSHRMSLRDNKKFEGGPRTNERKRKFYGPQRLRSLYKKIKKKNKEVLGIKKHSMVISNGALLGILSRPRSQQIRHLPPKL